MFTRCRLKMDKLHAILCTVCFLLCTVLLRSTTQKSGVEFNIYESERERIASSKEPVSYDKSIPLLWVVGRQASSYSHHFLAIDWRRMLASLALYTRHIGGVPRSGTTLARAMLDAHPDIRCGEETRVIPRILGMHAKTITSPVEMSRLSEAHIDEKLLREAMASYILTIIAGHGEPAPLLCNKDPFAIRSMHHILKMFPNSKFIMMIRDGRSVSHSIISRHVTIKGFDMKSYHGSLKDWNRAMGTMWEACRGSGPTVCLPVYYERLVLDPKNQMLRILNFLGVKWNDIVIHHEEAIGKKGGISLSRKEPSTDQVNKAVNLDALSKWYGVIPQSALNALEKDVPMLQRLGYDIHQYPPDYTKLLDPKAERTMNL